MPCRNFWSLTTILAVLSPFVTGNCNNFTASEDSPTTTTGLDQIISKGVVCDSPNSDYTFPNQPRCVSNTCPTVSYGVVNSIGTNNLSLTEDQVLPLYNLVYSKLSNKPVTFLYSLSSNVTSSSSCLNAKTANQTTAPAGYWIFTPSLLCVQGTLSQCTNGPVSDGTPIEICAVDAYGDTAENVVVNGHSSFVKTSPESAAMVNSNPASTVSPVARQPTTASAKRVVAPGLLGGLVMGMWLML